MNNWNSHECVLTAFMSAYWAQQRHKYDTFSQWKLRMPQSGQTNMTVNPLDSSNAYTFTSYNFSFSSSVVKLGSRVSMARDWSPRETSPGPIQRSKLHAELKVQPTTGPPLPYLSRLIVGRFGSLKVHLMDTLSGIRIQPQLQDTIRWATSFGVYFGVHLWWFIWVFFGSSRTWWESS